MRVELPFPPTWNRLYRVANNRHYMTRKGRDYIATVQHALNQSSEAMTFRNEIQPLDLFKVSIQVHAPNNLQRDLDNLSKVLNDSVFKWLGVNDSLIHAFQMIRRENIKEGKVFYKVETMTNHVQPVTLNKAKVGDVIRTSERDHVIIRIESDSFITRVEETSQEVVLGFDFVKRNAKVLTMHIPKGGKK